MGGVPHMTAAEFRRVGRRVVDAIADYYEGLESCRVLSASRPGDVLGMLPEHAPERGEGWEAILADVERVVMPGITHWQSPNFFAFFPANASYPAILGDLFCSGLGVQGMLWATSPACTEVEMRVMDWLAELIGLPAAFLHSGGAGGGVIQGTASESTLTAMVAARHGALGAGAAPESLVAYASTQAHSSIVKAAMVCGVARGPGDRERVRLIGTDGAFAMDPRLLGEAVRADARAGRRPFFVCASVGTTGSTAVDPVAAVAREIAGSGAWLHVDAAHAGAACVCPEFRWMLDGVERADSVTFNPHKWLLTNFDCNAFWVRSRERLTAAMSVTPEYLRNAASDAGSVVDFRDWHVPLGRRFRALKLWFVLRHYGAEGLRAHIREHVRLAAVFEELVRADERFEVAAPRTVNLVCFRLRAREGEDAAGTDARNRALMERVNASGRAYLTHTVLGEGIGARLVLRMCIGSPRTREEHVRAAWGLLSSQAR